ncbi:MAG TPA: HAMP domain-containing protein [Proteobacteria bacterium]|nr:methyl-accepting chemotaxis protein McpA [bacterium BMS3Abin14]HDL52649.1 HAMP domain-containing protein [Pseudomonadota bacterium]
MKIVHKISLFMLVFFGVGLFLGGTITYSSIKGVRSEMYKWFDGNAQTLAASIGSKTLESLHYFDYQAIEQTLTDDVQQDGNLVYGLVQFGTDLSEMKEAGDPGKGPYREYVFNIVEDGKTMGKVTIHYSTGVIEEKLASLIRMLGLGAAVTVVILLVSLYGLVVFLVNRPLVTLVKNTREIAAGNLLAETKVATNDEFGQLSDTFNQMRGSLVDMVGRVRNTFADLNAGAMEISNVSSDLSMGTDRQTGAVNDASVSIEEMSRTMKTISESVEGMSRSAEENSSSVLEIGASIEKVSESAGSLSTSIEQTSSSINQMNSSIHGVAENVEKLSAGISEVTSAITETDQSIKAVEEKAKRAYELSEMVSGAVALEGVKSVEKAVTGIVEAKEIVDTAAGAIENLAEKTKDIGKIVEIIEEVNDQTGLLALNAAIIAAQAGEHGKSFAVVAGEMRDLADKTTDSTKEITTLISSTQKESKKAVESVNLGVRRVEEGVELIRAVSETFKIAGENTQEAAEASKAIALTTTEQADSIRQLMVMANGMSEKFQQIAEATREQSLGSEQIILAVENMKNLAGVVTMATSEQAKGVTGIGKSSEETMMMAKRILESIKEEAMASDTIVGNVLEIKNITQSSLSAAKHLDTMVKKLTDQAGLLKEEIDRFRTEE